jgi:hypothetical protein
MFKLFLKWGNLTNLEVLYFRVCNVSTTRVADIVLLLITQVGLEHRILLPHCRYVRAFQPLHSPYASIF